MCDNNCSYRDKLISAITRLIEAIQMSTVVDEELKAQQKSMVTVALKCHDRLPKDKEAAMLHSVYQTLKNTADAHSLEVELCCEIEDPPEVVEVEDLEAALSEEEIEVLRKAQYDACEEVQNIFIDYMKNGIPDNNDLHERIGTACVFMTMIGMNIHPKEGGKYFGAIKAILTDENWKEHEVAAALLPQIYA